MRTHNTWVPVCFYRTFRYALIGSNSYQSNWHRQQLRTHTVSGIETACENILQMQVPN